MKILFVRCFGLGNAVMAIPTLKALKSLGHEITVLIGTISDDAGSYEVMLRAQEAGIIDHIERHDGDCVRVREGKAVFLSDILYDEIIASIPYDGRWGRVDLRRSDGRSGFIFAGKKDGTPPMDGRTRPDPSTIGLVSWKKHEVEYQMENAYALGYKGEIPDCSFLNKKP